MYNYICIVLILSMVHWLLYNHNILAGNWIDIIMWWHSRNIRTLWGYLDADVYWYWHSLNSLAYSFFYNAFLILPVLHINATIYAFFPNNLHINKYIILVHIFVTGICINSISYCLYHEVLLLNKNVNIVMQ